jgi:hypothetical protein
MPSESREVVALQIGANHHGWAFGVFVKYRTDGVVRTWGSESSTVEHGLLLAMAEFPELHQCDLPESIKEALNSGDGTYRP